ncbi:hypothetical protein FQN54_003519 [Arachnomyces sp. PD_36]|nr:hypothetical protein FQN54_003519 [Arachnomyces sp. PD_36]
MAYPNCLAADCYEGTINGIQVEWHGNAKMRLEAHAAAKSGDPQTLKAATEHFSYESAVRLGRTSMTIMGAMHSTTTNILTGVPVADEVHISVTFKPGNMKVHVYLDNVTEGPTAFDDVTVKGESVVKRNQTAPDPTLSTGSYPFKPT